MASRDLEAAIRISGELDASLRQAINRAVDGLGGLDDAARQASDAASRLSNTMDSQRDALRAAQRQYAAYVLSGEESSQAAQELANSIRELSSDLNRNESRMREAQEAAQRLTREMDDADGSFDRARSGLDDVSDSASDTEGGFTVMKGAIANVVGNGITALIGKCAEAASSLYGLAEETREFRQDMATLETAYAKAGFSAETAGDTWKDLYAIFGEDDRAVEAANNIARMADNQQELDKWTKITTGIWGTYQDALPVESLAEAAAETAKVGTVTGTFADALNWNSEAATMFADYMSEDVTTAEDAFNVALSECTSEAQRQALITDTLIALYGDAATKYEETAGSIMDANKATAEYSLKTAELGERIEPVTTAFQNGFNGILGKVLELTSGGDITGFVEKINGAFEWFGNTIFPLVQNVIPLLSQAFEQVKIRILPLKVLLQSMAKAVLPLISTVLSGLWPILLTLVDTLTPVIFAVRTIIGSLVPPLIGLVNMLMQILQTLAAIIRDTIGNAIRVVMPIINSLIGVFTNIIGFFQNVFLGNWTGVWESMKSIFSNAFQALVGIVKAPLNAVISIINGVISGINSMGFDIPDWVPVVGGQSFRINIPQIPMYAKGGFTDGVSIAGEMGTEAIISFDPRYRSQNLSYWAKAGQMLGAADFSLSGNSGGDSYHMGGVTFAPQITVTGMADKQSIMEAIRNEYPEFLDMLEEWWNGRGNPVYG